MTTKEKASMLIRVACIIGRPAGPSSTPELTGEAFTERYARKVWMGELVRGCLKRRPAV